MDSQLLQVAHKLLMHVLHVNALIVLCMSCTICSVLHNNTVNLQILTPLDGHESHNYNRATNILIGYLSYIYTHSLSTPGVILHITH